MNRDDFVLVDWLEDQRGSPISSFSKQRGENGRVLTYTSDFMAGITRSLVHKKDLEAKGYEERASRLWCVVAVVETQVVFNPTPPPAPESPVLVESLLEDSPVLVQATVPVLEELPDPPPPPKNPGGNVSSVPKQVRKR